MIAPTLPSLPQRAGHLTLRELIDLYMAHYAGRDTTRVQRLSWWAAYLAERRLDELSDDDVHAGLEQLAAGPARYFAGKDADGRAIHRAKPGQRSPATLNRYAMALSAVITWSIKRRIAPKGYVHPCRAIELRPEDNAKTRFLTVEERDRLLAACKAAKWPRLYLLVLMALSTGARRGELMGLRWADIDLARRVAHLEQTKNGDRRQLPLIPAVVEMLQQWRGAPTALVFASKGSPQIPYAFEQQWHTALQAAKIRGVTFHTLRHSTASFLAQNGASLLQIGDLLGHRSVAMARRYAHLATADRAALVNRVLGDMR
jgi:integrase